MSLVNVGRAALSPVHNFARFVYFRFLMAFLGFLLTTFSITTTSVFFLLAD